MRGLPGRVAGLLLVPALAAGLGLPPASASAGDPASADVVGDRGGPTDGTSRTLSYVALGDSYSAASGVLPPDPEAPALCLRSQRNYPHVLAARTGADLVDVTCGGADTGDYREAQYEGVAPQLDALSAETDLVTMTIGGNDSNVFVGSIVACGAAALTTAGRGNPCEQRYGSSFADTVREDTFPALVRALRDVHRRAPAAEVAILTYPWILPRRVGCFDSMPVARGDVPYLRDLQTVLNRVVARAAARTDSTLVDLDEVSEGHDACQDIGTRWIEPVTQGTNPVVVHPNALGERRMARRTQRVLGLPSVPPPPLAPLRAGG